MAPARGEPRLRSAILRRVSRALAVMLGLVTVVAFASPVAAAAVPLVSATSASSSPAGPLAPSKPGLVHPWIALNQVPNLTVQQAAAAAPNSDLAIIKASEGSLVPAMKAANPALTILVYQNGANDIGHNAGTNYPDAWYARDAKGNKIIQPTFHNYLMDVSNTDWQNEVVTECRADIALTGADGCYTDLLSTAPLVPGYESAVPINPATGKTWTFAAYQAAVDQIAAMVRDQVDGPSAANGVNNGKRWYAANGVSSQPLTANTDASHAEVWLRDQGQSVNAWPTLTSWTQDVNMVHDAEAAGNTLLVETKLWTTATTAQVTQWRRFALASFLLATSGSSWFLFSPTQTAADMTTADPEQNTALGTPTDAYSQLSDTSVFTRDFSAGFAAVNTGDSAVTIPLPDGSWTDLDGNVACGSATLPPHSGMLWSAGQATAPSVTIATPSANSQVSGSLTVSGSTNQGSSGNPIQEVDVAVDGGPGAAAGGTDSWTAVVDTTSLSDGPHTIHARTIDASGGCASQSVHVTVSNPHATGTATCTALTCSFDSLGSVASQGSSLASYRWDFGDGSTGAGATTQHDYSAPGTYHYSLTVTDANGATSAPATGDATPRAPPTLNISTPSAGSTLTGTVTVTGTASAGSANLDHVTVSMDGGSPVPATGTTSWSAQLDLSSLAAGAHTVAAQVTDVDGVTAGASIPINVVAVPPNQPPAAAASVSCTNLRCDFDGSTSADADGSIASYSWDFGDGATATAAAPSHVYPTGKSYNYSLTVTDDKGATDTVQGTATPTNGPAVASAKASCNGLVCAFDATKSSEAGGTIASYAWHFGDGSSGTGASPSHTYSATGTYSFSVTVTAADGATDTAIGSVSPVDLPPVAAASVTCTGLTCSFDASGSSDADGSVASYSWAFGDGQTGSGAKPTHKYAAGGNVTYSLTVSDPQGAVSNVFHGTATPQDAPPVALPKVSCQGLTCSFDGSGSSDPDGTVASYAWKFGDGGTSSTVSPKHSYPAAGTYTYTLTVTDDQGLAGSAVTGSVTVSPQPVRFRASTHAYVKATVTSGASITAPTAVQPGDTELLFVASSALDATNAPAGWTLVKQQKADPLQVKVFKRLAGPADAGATVTVPVLAPAGFALQLADYRGVGPTVSAVSAPGRAPAVLHTTPGAVVSTPGSWVVSYWADLSSTTKSWTLPSAVTSRDIAVGAGGAHTSGATGDSGKPAGIGTTTGRTARVSGGTSSKAAMLTVVLAPSLS